MTSEPEYVEMDDVLLDAPMQIEGALTEASNVTLRVQLVIDGEASEHRAVYKPISGERPLHDFPLETLGRREVAAYLISQWGGFGLIPRTILREGPLGLGSVQEWKDVQESTSGLPACGLMNVVRPQDVEPGWLTVLEAEDYSGAPLSVVHRDEPDLASLCVLDIVMNNADRKAAHIALDARGVLWAFDHGLIGHDEPKLRTVLWGWAGEPIPSRDVARLEVLANRLDSGGDTELLELLSRRELVALQTRIAALLIEPVFPDVPGGRYPLPWPLW
ncbi:MAG: SCO1664 family protein [Ornithinimicrobium sp.]